MVKKKRIFRCAALLIGVGLIAASCVAVAMADSSAFPDPFVTRGEMDFELWAPAAYTVESLYAHAEAVVLADCISSETDARQNYLSLRVIDSFKGALDKGTVFSAVEKGSRRYENDENGKPYLAEEVSSCGVPLIGKNMRVLLFLNGKTGEDVWGISPQSKFFVSGDEIYAAVSLPAYFCQQYGSPLPMEASGGVPLTVCGFEEGARPLNEVLSSMAK